MITMSAWASMSWYVLPISSASGRDTGGCGQFTVTSSGFVVGHRIFVRRLVAHLASVGADR